MADHRESQVLGYILAALVVAISGIAVGLASTTPSRETEIAPSTGASETAPAGVGSADAQKSTARP